MGRLNMGHLKYYLNQIVTNLRFFGKKAHNSATLIRLLSCDGAIKEMYEYFLVVREFPSKTRIE